MRRLCCCLVLLVGLGLPIHGQDKKPAARPDDPAGKEVLPPKVMLAAPGVKDPLALTGPTLEVEATAQGQGKESIASLQLLLDGRPYRGADSLRKVAADPGAAVTVKWKLEIPPGEHTLRVLARTQSSLGLSEELKVAHVKPGPRGKLHVLALGISDYKDRTRKLPCAAGDARALAETFAQRSKGLYEVVPRVLTDGQATRAEVRAALKGLKEKMGAADVAVIFFAGEGVVDGRTRSFFLLPHEGDADNLADTAISGEEIARSLATLPGRVLLLLDASHSGAIGKTINAAAGDLPEDFRVVVMCGALGNEKAREDRERGFFCRALIEALEGKGAKNPADGCVYLHHLEQYVSDRVGELSGNEQHVTTMKPAGQPFALARPR